MTRGQGAPFLTAFQYLLAGTGDEAANLDLTYKQEWSEAPLFSLPHHLPPSCAVPRTTKPSQLFNPSPSSRAFGLLCSPPESEPLTCPQSLVSFGSRRGRAWLSTAG